MHKGEVVEEGDHESLMRAGGTYFGLVEQQKLRLAEEEEQLAFEQQEIVEIVLAHQVEENQSSVGRGRASTLISITPSIMAALYGKRNGLTIGEGSEEDNDDVKKAKVKLTIRFILTNIIY